MMRRSDPPADPTPWLLETVLRQMDVIRSYERVTQDMLRVRPPLAESVGDDGRLVIGVSFFERVEAFEKSMILAALLKTQGKVLPASTLLGLKRSTLSEKIERYGLREFTAAGVRAEPDAPPAVVGV